MDQEIYLKKGISYFINPRLDLISLMPTDSFQKVLEIGMGGGDTLVYIKRNKLASEVVGVDLVELPDSNQHNSLIDKTYFFNVETEEFPFEKNYFDVIIVGDILEHLIDPLKVLKKLAQVLKPHGLILISIPNIRDIKAIYSILMKGRFQYTTEGIFDKTHLRFFCKKDMIDLIKSVDEFTVLKIFPIQEIASNSPNRKLFNKLTFRIFEQFLSSQYIFIAKKNSQTS